MLGMCCRVFKGFIHYFAILVMVTLSAATIGCLFLQGGDLQFFVQPEAMIHFPWVKRAGLKVTILFVATIIFFMLAEDGPLRCSWISALGLGRRHRRRQAMQRKKQLRRRPFSSQSVHTRLSSQIRYRMMP